MLADARKTAEFYLHARDTQLTSNPPLRPRDFTVYVSVAFPNPGDDGARDGKTSGFIKRCRALRAIEHVGIVA